ECILPILLRMLSTTHCPYTTLFRSRTAEDHSGALRLRAAELLERRCRYRQQPGVRAAMRARSGGRFRQFEVIVFINIICQGAPPDRKNTRLNSSHVKISYAVFCLKK